MSKKYIVRKRVNKRNVFLLAILVSFLVIGGIKLLTGKKEETVTATSSNKKVSSTVDEDSSKKIEDKKPQKTHFTVVVDASFGGSDGGSKGYNGIIQKNINLDLALKIRDILEKHSDIDVVLTRDKDETVSMESRIKIINDSKADLLVSIMQNSEGTGNVSGVETYVLPREEKNSNPTFGYVLQQAMSMYVDTKDRGVLARNMNILTNSSVPGAVVNTGFITNKKEGTSLASEKYQLRMAEGISQGILSYIDRYLKEN